jgi:hypothetical protein
MASKPRGPAPQRDSQRRRRNKPTSYGAAEPVMTEAAAFRPELGITDPQPQIADLWNALQRSAEAKFYSDADWHRARVELVYGNELLRRIVHEGRVSGQAWATFQNALTELLISPAAKRRAGIETRPVVDAQVDAADAKILDLVEKLKA